MRRYRQLWISGGFVNYQDSNVNSLNGINAASLCSLQSVEVTGPMSLADLTINSLTGAAGWRGIAAINSGTTVASVAATAARSGAVVTLSIYMYAQAPNSQAFNGGLAVESIRAGAFEIRAINSFAPVGTANVAWEIVR